jgi:guanine deaminase
MIHQYMQRAIKLAQKGMDNNEGGPFGCVIVRNGEIIAEGNNRVTITNDPTAHAEIVAIRRACKKLGDFQLQGCDIYTSCEPCPMCLGAIYWSRADHLYYAGTREDAAKAGFDDSFIYKELNLSAEKRSIPTKQFLHDDAQDLFNKWIEKEDKIEY